MVLARHLSQRAAKLSTDLLLGLKVDLRLSLQAMNATGLLMMHSATLREALANIVRYQQLVSNSGCISSHKVPGGLTVRYTVTPCHVEMHPMQIDSLFGGLLAFLKRCSTHSVAPRRVSLPAVDVSENGLGALSTRTTALGEAGSLPPQGIG